MNLAANVDQERAILRPINGKRNFVSCGYKTFDKLYIMDLHGNAKKRKYVSMEVPTEMSLISCKA
jgi:hypothetical protein